jgi:hypothetical protein
MVAGPALSLLRTSGLERRPSPKGGAASGELQQRLRQLRQRGFPAHAGGMPIIAVRASKIALKRKATLSSALQAISRSVLRHFAANEPAVLAGRSSQASEKKKSRLVSFAAGVVVGSERGEIGPLLDAAKTAARNVRRAEKFWS